MEAMADTDQKTSAEIHRKVASGLPPAQARASSEFERASRHSRHVHVFKLTLPALALALGAGFIGYSWVSSPSSLPISVEGTAIRDGKLVMANPKLDGFNKENQAYSMTAARAIQDLQNTGVIDLEEISAKVPVGVGNFALIQAATGVYDNDGNTLDITSPVTVKTTDGMTARLKSAKVDIGAGELATDEPVDISLKGSRIEADTFKVGDRGKVFVFENRVKVTIEPREARMADARPGASDGKN